MEEHSDHITASRIYKAGIIGCGFIGAEAPDSHAQAYIDSNRTELLVVCDKNIDKALDCAAKYDILSHRDDYVDMAREYDLDIVSVCTPIETHCQIVCDIVPYVKAIWCEKPMASTLEECDRMIEVCKKNKTLLMINHQRNFATPVFRFSRGFINTGTHLFALLLEQFEYICLEGGKIYLGLEPQLECDIEYLETKEPVFEFDWVHNKKRMLPEVLRILIYRMEHPIWQEISGMQSKEALRLALEFQEQYEKGT